MHKPCAAVCSQSRVSSGAGAVFVPEDAQHKLEQGTELGQQSIAPTASHAWGTPTQQELLVLFSLLFVIRTGALFLSCTASRPPSTPMPLLGASLSREPPMCSGKRRGWSWVAEGGSRGRGGTGAAPSCSQPEPRRYLGYQPPPAPHCPQQPDHGSGAGPALLGTLSAQGNISAEKHPLGRFI